MVEKTTGKVEQPLITSEPQETKVCRQKSNEIDRNMVYNHYGMANKI